MRKQFAILLVIVAVASTLARPAGGIRCGRPGDPGCGAVPQARVASAAALSPAWSVPFADIQNTLYVTCSISGPAGTRLGNCLLDTGSQLSLAVPQRWWRTLGVAPSEQFTTFGIGGEVPGIAGDAVLRLPYARGELGPIPVQVSTTEGYPLPDGDLGLPVLQAACPSLLSIDFQTSRVECFVP